jgi:hypothetical protein
MAETFGFTIEDNPYDEVRSIFHLFVQQNISVYIYVHMYIFMDIYISLYMNICIYLSIYA